MSAADCVFCKVIAGEFDCAKIWEDENFLAILDINPNTSGMALVMPKLHFDSNLFDLPEKTYSAFLLAAKEVAALLEKGLDVSRVALVMEGMGVNHAHIKLYPLRDTDERFKDRWSKEKVFFEHYPGYVTTQLGSGVPLLDLKKQAEDLRKKTAL